MSDHTCEWKDAIIDACVVDWILIAEHEHDPRRAVNDLLCWQQQLALDPAVSEPAAKLHARIAELEAAMSSISALPQQWRERKFGGPPYSEAGVQLLAEIERMAKELAALCPEETR